MKIINWTAMFLISLLYGCSSVPKEQPGSGFLSQYRGLTPLESTENERYFLYSKGERTLQRYKRIHVEPVALHVPKELRDSWGQQIQKHSKLQKYFTRELEQRMSHRFVLTDTPGPDTLTLRVAITGGELNLQPLKPYQIFPWALIIQGVGEASGLRGKMFNMYQEAELVDSVTGNQIVALVGGLQLGPVSRRALDRMSTEELKIMVDDWINAFCRNLPMCHQPEELSDPLSESSGKR